MTCAVVCYVLMGTPAGYSSARIYKMFGGEKWKSNVLLTAFLVPGCVYGHLAHELANGETIQIGCS